MDSKKILKKFTSAENQLKSTFKLFQFFPHAIQQKKICKILQPPASHSFFCLLFRSLYTTSRYKKILQCSHTIPKHPSIISDFSNYQNFDDKFEGQSKKVTASQRPQNVMKFVCLHKASQSLLSKQSTPQQWLQNTAKFFSSTFSPGFFTAWKISHKFSTSTTP